ncbi:ParB N-terminal domain-containing protein [Nocardia uniformis]|uniref:ParB N-terminal domain-containing protein n=1 Tax=Nocardia uniformis TaxID=53432 RepID=A0A849CBQ9_9NOCA|nr:ParB N-terminal domain-containing protein [Nocardia uniformis]NNH73790.1 ParB N-terminal domain-containing protein [Nocardia uniformis]
MTTTTIDTTETTVAAAQSDIEEPATGLGDSIAAEALFLPPERLVLDENVRKSFDLDDYPEVKASIQRGVEIPIMAHRESDGTITVVDGQIRTLVAIELKVPTVPVWVTPAPQTDPAEREICRTSQQIRVNDHRIALTDGDRAAGMARMFDFGASLTRISEEIGQRREQVKLAVTVGRSQTACAAIDAHQLDFEQAAVLAVYENVDDTDAVARLLAAPRSMFTYHVRRIAAEREESRDRFRESLPYAAEGFGVHSRDPRDDDGFIAAEWLRTSDGAQVSVAQIHAAPALWTVYCQPTEVEVLIDHDTGEVVDPDSIDPATKDHPNAVAAEGLRHADSVERGYLWAPEYYLRADRLDESGFRHAGDFVEPIPEEPGIGPDAQPDPAEPVDPEAAEARRRAAAEQAAAAQAAAEAARAQEAAAKHRRDELNKQGHAALEARREFLTRFLSRKTAPPAAVWEFVAQALAEEPDLLLGPDADRLAYGLLGVKGGKHALLTAIEPAKPPRCQVIVLALVLGAYEGKVTKSAWQYRDAGVSRYLHFLASLGHVLTSVEQAAAGDLDPDSIDIDS